MSYNQPEYGRGDDNSRPGYLSAHWIGCDCDACRRNQAEHIRRFGTGCRCPICSWHRDRERNLARERQQKMSTVNVCDRCETLVKASALGSLSIETTPVAGRSDKEICPGCVAEFLAWYDGTPGERPKAYSKPYTPPKSDETDPVDALANKLAQRLTEAPRALPNGNGDETPQDRPTPRNVRQTESDPWGHGNGD